MPEPIKNRRAEGALFYRRRAAINYFTTAENFSILIEKPRVAPNWVFHNTNYSFYFLLFWFYLARGVKKSTPKAVKFRTSNSPNYTFIYIIVFIVIYILLTIYAQSPVYCIGPEEVPNTTAENSSSSTFMGVNNNVAAAWIAATGAVIATVTAH